MSRRPIPGPPGPPGPTGPPGPGGAGVPLSNVRWVDFGTSVAPGDQDGSIGAPFSTITAAVADCPAGGTLLITPSPTGYASEPAVTVEKDLTFFALGMTSPGGTELNTVLPELTNGAGAGIRLAYYNCTFAYSGVRGGSHNAINCISSFTNPAMTADIFARGFSPACFVEAAGCSGANINNCVIDSITALGTVATYDCLWLSTCVVTAPGSASMRGGSGCLNGAKVITARFHWDEISQHYGSQLDLTDAVLVERDGSEAQGSLSGLIVPSGASGHVPVGDGNGGWVSTPAPVGPTGPTGAHRSNGANRSNGADRSNGANRGNGPVRWRWGLWRRIRDCKFNHVRLSQLGRASLGFRFLCCVASLRIFIRYEQRNSDLHRDRPNHGQVCWLGNRESRRKRHERLARHFIEW